KANTAVVATGAIAYLVGSLSAAREERTVTPKKRIPSMLWAKQLQEKVRSQKAFTSRAHLRSGIIEEDFISRHPKLHRCMKTIRKPRRGLYRHSHRYSETTNRIGVSRTFPSESQNCMRTDLCCWLNQVYTAPSALRYIMSMEFYSITLLTF
ncbi:hypothetical protein ARMSODRAFT_900680, partial [Armillaria solidipes]